MDGFPEGIFLNGTVGVGKTTVAVCIGQALQQLGIAHAVIDLDAIRRAWPPPAGDRFNHELELVNLASLVENYADAGIGTFVMAGVIEEAGEIERYRRALQGRPFGICRITADASVLRTRLTSRHRGDPDGLRWHLKRAVELDSILVKRSLDDFVVDSSNRPAESVAQEILACLQGDLQPSASRLS
jgi:adenylylsulfate kinase-like enzyme